MDIIQRFMPFGVRRHRFGELVAYHLNERSLTGPERLSEAPFAS